LKRVLYVGAEKETSEKGIRKIAYSPIRNQIATGDESGNIRIY